MPKETTEAKKPLTIAQRIQLAKEEAKQKANTEFETLYGAWVKSKAATALADYLVEELKTRADVNLWFNADDNKKFCNFEYALPTSNFVHRFANENGLIVTEARSQNNGSFNGFFFSRR
jgi:chlorite dismutase